MQNMYYEALETEPKAKRRTKRLSVRALGIPKVVIVGRGNIGKLK